MNTTYYSRTHVRDLRNLARTAKLSAPNTFWTESENVLVSVYNGIGPESWSNRFRRLTTFLLQFFEADALIHDYEYSLQKKSYKKFTQANFRFLINSIKLSFRIHSLKWAFRVSAMGILLAFLCQLFGYSGYLKSKT